MRKRNFKGRCTKRSIPKCLEICRTYDAVQTAYADVLAQDDEVQEFRCNVYLEGLLPVPLLLKLSFIIFNLLCFNKIFKFSFSMHIAHNLHKSVQHMHLV